MFHGSVPADLRSIIDEHARGWAPGTDVYVGCSGNYTIERVLHPRGFKLHSNDVQAYSSALGFWFADGDVPFEIREEHREELEWLEPYLDHGVGTLAVLMMGTTFLDSVGRKSRFHERVIHAYKSQMDRMHAATVKRIQDNPLKLQTFSAMDVREWLEEKGPHDAPVAMFPPFFKGDYENQFKALDKFFDWPCPEYPELDEEGKDALVQQVVDRPDWTIGLHIPRDELRPYLRGMVQTTNRGVPIHVYSAGHQSRVVRPRQALEVIPMPKVSPTADLTDAKRLSLHMLTDGQFSQIRSQFMSKTIKPGSPWLCIGVAVDGAIIGAFAYKLPEQYDPQCLYLLSDFPVPWSRHRRLSKLIVMAALSEEARHIAQRTSKRLYERLATTAFSDNPQSAKYGRGVPGMKLAARKKGTDGVHTYMLNYIAPFGVQTLDELLKVWQQKHAKDQRRVVAPTEIITTTPDTKD